MDPCPQVRIGNPASYDPAANGGNPGDIVVANDGNSRSTYGLIRRPAPGSPLVVERLLPLVTIEAIGSDGGSGIVALRIHAENANGDAVTGTYQVFARAAADPITAVAAGADGAVPWSIGDGSEQVLALATVSLAGFVDVLFTGTAGDTVTWWVTCLSNPADVVTGSRVIPA